MKKENRKNLVGVRLTDVEISRLVRLCEEANLPRSDLIRMAIDDVTIYRVDGFKEFTVQLLKCGNNLNQIARVLNQNPNSSIVECLGAIQQEFNELKKSVSEIGEYLCR